MNSLERSMFSLKMLRSYKQWANQVSRQWKQTEFAFKCLKPMETRPERQEKLQDLKVLLEEALALNFCKGACCQCQDLRTLLWKGWEYYMQFWNTPFPLTVYSPYQVLYIYHVYPFFAWLCQIFCWLQENQLHSHHGLRTNLHGVIT